MNATEHLHELGQSLWLDNITRGLLVDGTLRGYLRDFAVTGLTSNPTIFEHAIRDTISTTRRYAKRRLKENRMKLFFRAGVGRLDPGRRFVSSDLRRDCGHRWLGLARSVALAGARCGGHDQASRAAACARATAESIHQDSGYCRGLQAIEESILPACRSMSRCCSRASNISRRQKRTCAASSGASLPASIRKSRSVASIFVSRWDVAVKEKVSAGFRNRLGIAIAMRTYKAYRELLASQRWQKLSEAGAQPQRLLWASTGTKDPAASDTLYLEALAAPNTINTIPEKTLLAFADHGVVSGSMPADGGDAEEVLADFARAGVDDAALAIRLQQDGTASFSQSWSELMAVIPSKRDASGPAGIVTAKTKP